MRYRKRIKLIDAVQFTPGEKPPEGFQWEEVYLEHRIDRGQGETKKCTGPHAQVFDYAPGVHVRACPGDYVLSFGVKEGRGLFSVLDKAAFEMQYEAAD